MNQPTPPIPIAGGASAATSRLQHHRVELSDSFLTSLGMICEVTVDPAELAEASRDWWPLAMTWAIDGQVGSITGAVANPTASAQVAEILKLCSQHKVPVTAAAGRSGVCGGVVPVHGGLTLNMCGITGIRSVDTTSLVVDVRAGTFGDDYENELRSEHNLTGGHWPQSMSLSTVGGWLACRGAGQFSTRYGKIEDMVVGLDVALADGSVISTGGAPRGAVGPDLNQLFVGSEGTLGVITGARLKAHRLPKGELKAAYGFDSFSAGLAACREILHRGATPAVLRLYDTIESERNFEIADHHVLLVLDEADPEMIAATETIVSQECADAANLDNALVDKWMGHRNDVAALESFISTGFVVDTLEVAAPWSVLDAVYEATTNAISNVEGTIAASAHQSHSYHDGACVYFTFAAHPDKIPGSKDDYYRAVWDAGTRASLAAGANLSHHHGVGLNRSKYVQEALGPAHGTLADIKAALDPSGILNPGKLGLPDPWET